MISLLFSHIFFLNKHIQCATIMSQHSIGKKLTSIRPNPRDKSNSYDPSFTSNTIFFPCENRPTSSANIDVIKCYFSTEVAISYLKKRASKATKRKLVSFFRRDIICVAARIPTGYIHTIVGVSSATFGGSEIVFMYSPFLPSRYSVVFSGSCVPLSLWNIGFRASEFCLTNARIIAGCETQSDSPAEGKSYIRRDATRICVPSPLRRCTIVMFYNIACAVKYLIRILVCSFWTGSRRFCWIMSAVKRCVVSSDCSCSLCCDSVEGKSLCDVLYAIMKYLILMTCGKCMNLKWGFYCIIIQTFILIIRLFKSKYIK